jgi:hypothetical protein
MGELDSSPFNERVNEEGSEQNPGPSRRFPANLLRTRWLAPLVLALVVLAPYHRLLVGTAIPIPDDIFISDLADGDFPARVEAGRLIRAGELPLWTSGIWTGFPLACAEPVSLMLFTVLPPALALGWLIALCLLAAALGTYALARQFGASRLGSTLAGFAFAWSGFIVCQMRHLGTLTIVALFPLALLLLDRAATGGLRDVVAARSFPLRRRLLWLSGFAAIFGLQLLAGFPQSAYNAALVYAALVTARGIWLLAPWAQDLDPSSPRAAPSFGLLFGALAAVTIAILIGMVQLLPLWELGALSDRAGGGTFEWATKYNYWPPNVLTFFIPYINGDISDLSYTGSSIFWEDYGYVGLFTVLLAFVAIGSRLKRFAVAFWLIAGLFAYGLVLGRATPLFGIAFSALPGMSSFRFPTRFLFIVELALALLGGLGLTVLEEFLEHRRRRGAGRLLASLVAIIIVTATAADLIYHNRRQNPLVDADRWLARPASAATILASHQSGRVYSPGSQRLHTTAFYLARGWSGDLGPYLAHREMLQPNSNLLHGVAAVDGYAGIEPSWTVDLLGDHNRTGILGRLYRLEKESLAASPAFFDLLEAISVRWVILPFQILGDRMEHVASVGSAELYRLPGALPRARVVSRARVVGSTDQLTKLLASGEIDLRRELIFHDPANLGLAAGLDSSEGGSEAVGEARLVVDGAIKVVIDAVAPRGGWLLLSDTWYPGWKATVDGRPAPVLRANVAHRAVLLPPGNHRVVFSFRPASTARGFVLSAAGLAILLGGVAGLLRKKSRPESRRRKNCKESA